MFIIVWNSLRFNQSLVFYSIRQPDETHTRLSSGLASARFILSASDPSQFPDSRGREVAFAGRSNAGKSSAINALTSRRGLAHVAKAPGKTRLVNFFGLDEDRCLVDLPGYGYAKVPARMRQQWGQLIENYLVSRKQLAGLLLVMDCRHPLTELDQQLLAWFSPLRRPLLVLLSKADKLNRQQRGRVLYSVREALNDAFLDVRVELFSAVDRTGVEKARELLEQWLDLPGAAPCGVDLLKIKSPRSKGSKNRGQEP